MTSSLFSEMMEEFYQSNGRITAGHFALKMMPKTAPGPDPYAQGVAQQFQGPQPGPSPYAAPQPPVQPPVQPTYQPPSVPQQQPTPIAVEVVESAPASPAIPPAAPIAMAGRAGSQALLMSAKADGDSGETDPDGDDEESERVASRNAHGAAGFDPSRGTPGEPPQPPYRPVNWGFVFRFTTPRLAVYCGGLLALVFLLMSSLARSSGQLDAHRAVFIHRADRAATGLCLLALAGAGAFAVRDFTRAQEVLHD